MRVFIGSWAFLKENYDQGCVNTSINTYNHFFFSFFLIRYADLPDKSSIHHMLVNSNMKCTCTKPHDGISCPVIHHHTHATPRDVSGTHPSSEAYGLYGWARLHAPSVVFAAVVNTGASHSPQSKQSKTAPIQRKNSRSQCRQRRVAPHDSRHHGGTVMTRRKLHKPLFIRRLNTKGKLFFFFFIRARRL